MSICKAYGVFPYALYTNCIPIDARFYAGKYRKRAVETNSTALLFICFNINFYDVLNIALQNAAQILDSIQGYAFVLAESIKRSCAETVGVNQLVL